MMRDREHIPDELSTGRGRMGARIVVSRAQGWLAATLRPPVRTALAPKGVRPFPDDPRPLKRRRERPPPSPRLRRARRVLPAPEPEGVRPDASSSATCVVEPAKVTPWTRFEAAHPSRASRSDPFRRCAATSPRRRVAPPPGAKSRHRVLLPLEPLQNEDDRLSGFQRQGDGGTPFGITTSGRRSSRRRRTR